jgi:hypothetical protein
LGGMGTCRLDATRPRDRGVVRRRSVSRRTRARARGSRRPSLRSCRSTTRGA